MLRSITPPHDNELRLDVDFDVISARKLISIAPKTVVLSESRNTHEYLKTSVRDIGILRAAQFSGWYNQRHSENTSKAESRTYD